MCETRRAFAASVEYCWPATCSPVAVSQVGRRVRIGDRFREAGRIERQKEDRAGKIRGHHTADLVAGLFTRERDHSDRHRFEIGARMHVDVAVCDRGRGCERAQA
jgi:hypothetical protein